MKILLDMDGVIVDFVTGSLKLFGVNPVEFFNKNPTFSYHYWDLFGATRGDVDGEVERAGEKFWIDLQPYAHARELYDFCVQIAPTFILSKPMLPASSASGKILWLRQWLKDPVFMNYMLGSDKDLCARTDHLLIDDYEENVTAFRKAGGSAILVPARWNRRHADLPYLLEHVKDEIDCWCDNQAKIDRICEAVL